MGQEVEAGGKPIFDGVVTAVVVMVVVGGGGGGFGKEFPSKPLSWLFPGQCTPEYQKVHGSPAMGKMFS